MWNNVSEYSNGLKSTFQALKLNERLRKLREVETKGFWEGQIGIKQRKYVDISVPFNDITNCVYILFIHSKFSEYGNANSPS